MTSLVDVLKAPRSLVFGHRGASAYAPMNTIPAFELAVEQGADGIELDVRFSKDGELVILHDATVDHTTNGNGAVAEMTFAQIRELDAGSWKDAKFRGVQIPTLDEVFDAVGNKLFINVEIKAESNDETGLEAAVAECIRRHNMQQRVIMSSFNPLVLRRFGRMLPDVLMGFLHADETPYYAWHLLYGVEYQAVNPHHTMIDEAYIVRAKMVGHMVNTWTVNDPQRVTELRDLGVKGIITDIPDMVREALGY